MAAEPMLHAAKLPVGSPGAFDRWLHAMHFRGEGVRHFLLGRVKPAGLGVICAWAGTGVLAAGFTRSALFQAFALSVLLILSGFIWLLFRRATLAASRELPRHATVGVPVRYTVRVKHTGTRTLRRAWLLESPPDTRPGLFEFFYSREPGEHERNRFDRTVAYYRWRWLVSRGTGFSCAPSDTELCLKPGGKCSVQLEITPRRRGVIRLSDLRVLLPDPCGLVQNRIRVDASSSTLLVLPRRHPLPQIRLPGSMAFELTGEALSNTIGTSGEFLGLREYRAGDPMRLIHWKSWARTGYPIVRELEDTYFPRYALVLDTWSPSGADECFEDAVSVAASFAAAIDTHDSLLDLMFVKDEAHVVTAGRGLERTEKLLEVLAGVTPEASPDFTALKNLVLRHRDGMASCLIVFNGWDEARADFLQSLLRSGILCVPIVVGRGHSPPDLPGYWLESGHVARDLQKLPTRF